MAKSRRNPDDKRNKNLKPGGDWGQSAKAGAPKGRRWGTVVKELLDKKLSPESKAKLDAALSKQLGPTDYRSAVSVQAIARALGVGPIANKAAEFLRDTEEGKPAQSLDVTSDGERINAPILYLPERDKTS